MERMPSVPYRALVSQFPSGDKEIYKFYNSEIKKQIKDTNFVINILLYETSDHFVAVYIENKTNILSPQHSVFCERNYTGGCENIFA